MSDDDIPGTPGVRSIGGTPLSELGGDDGGGGGGSGGGGGGGGGSDPEPDEPDIAPNVSGDAVRRSIEEGISVEEAQRQINEERSSSETSGSSNSGTVDQTQPDTPDEPAPEDTSGTTAGATGSNTGPAGAVEEPADDRQSDQSDLSDAQRELLNQDPNELPEWALPDRDPEGSINTSASPQTAGAQFRYQEFRDLERAPPGTIARGITGDELRASMRFQEQLSSNTNRSGSAQADARVNPDTYRPEQDTTQEQADQIREAQREAVAEQTQQQAEQQLAEELEGTDPEDVNLDAVQSDDVNVQFWMGDDGQIQTSAGLDPDARQSLQEQVATRQLEQSLEEQFGGEDLQPGDDFTVEQGEDGQYQTELSEEFQQSETYIRTAAAEQLSDEMGEEISPEEVQLQETEDGVQPLPPASLLEERASDRATQQIRGENPDAESVLGRHAFPGLQQGEHYEVTVDGGQSSVELTAEGQEVVTRTLARTENPNADSELAREEVEGELQFDDQGNITNIQQAEQFGDVPVVDDALRGAGDWLSSNVIQPSASGLAGFVGGIGQAAVTIAPGEDPAMRRSLKKSEEIIEAGLGGGGETLNVPNTAAGLIEIGEFGGEAAAETWQGDAGEFADKTEAAAGQAASKAAEQASENPAETAAAVIGSLAVTAGTIGAASRLSGTAGRASALAIQPGEEIATAGANRLLSTTSRGQRILNAFPNNRVDNEEIVLRGLQRGARRARASLQGGGARLRQAVRERTPNVDVSVEQNPDAPAVDVRRGGSGSNAQEGLDDLIDESQDADVSATDTLMDASRGIDDRLLSRQLQLQAAGDRATEGVDDLITESQTADVSATEEILGLSRSIDDRVLGAQRRLEGAMLRARSRARRGEDGVDDLIAESQSADVSITEPIMRASYGIDNRVLSRQLQLQAAGDRATEGFDDLVTESQAADASLESLVMDASYGIDERLLAAQARASDEISILEEGVDDLVTESQAADASLEDLVLDASYGIDEGVLRAQARAGSEVQNLEEGLDDLVTESQSADVSAGELLGRARDTTVTVEIGKPSQRELPADVFELDEGATPTFEGEISGEGDVFDPSGIEAETTTGESQQLQIAAEQERDRSTTAVESEQQGSAAPEFDGRLEADFPEPSETLADQFDTGEVSLEEDLGVSGTDDFEFTDIAQPEDLGSDLGAGVDESLGYDDDLDLRQELEPESDVETDTERETDTRIDTELGQEPGFDNELENVLEFETETETETEAEWFGPDEEENNQDWFVDIDEEDEEFGTGFATAEELAAGWDSEDDWVDSL